MAGNTSTNSTANARPTVARHRAGESASASPRAISTAPLTQITADRAGVHDGSCPKNDEVLTKWTVPMKTISAASAQRAAFLAKPSLPRMPGTLAGTNRFSDVPGSPMPPARYPEALQPDAHPFHPPPVPVRPSSAVVALTLAASLVLALAGPAAARRATVRPGPRARPATPSRFRSTPTGATVPGIDVSHWQGNINWAKVAGAGKRFVFLKATDGQDYIDPTFATNRAGARENGLMVGAYHFARPDDSAGDAIKEAQFFVEVADPKPGHLLPVLDIETNDGLSHDEMTAWAHRFVMEVRDLTGVMPFVYTSPYGWLDRFGDSRRLARDGAPLWVAHWGVSSPTLPAGDWDGRGWVVWQHSSTGHVAGIGGDVDLDVLAGASLGRIAIRRLTVQVDGGAGSVTTAPVGYGCRTTCERNVDPDRTITLTASPDEGAYFTGWGGDCSGTGPTCAITTNGNRTVTAGFVNDVAPPVVALATPSGLSDPAVVSFDEPVRGVNPSNVVLRAPGQLRVDATRVCRNARARCATATPTSPGRSGSSRRPRWCPDATTSSS